MAAIVTGSDSGIGRATAVALARRGHDVGVTFNSDEDGARKTAAEVRSHGVHGEVRHLDLARLDSVQPAIDELADALGEVEILVNNAGAGTAEPFLEMELERWNDVLAVNLTGTMLVAQAVARRMVDAGTRGRIVNVTSVHEHVPLALATGYVVSKHAIGGLTRCMALELAEHAITVNSVAPGEIATPMTGLQDEDPHKVQRTCIPLGRPGDAREVAELIAFLTSPEASYTTGASYVIDGGMLLMAAEANRIAKG